MKKPVIYYLTSAFTFFIFQSFFSQIGPVGSGTGTGGTGGGSGNTNTCVANDDDYSVNATDNSNSPILELKLKFHIIQKESSNPQNFTNVQTDLDFLENIVNESNQILANLAPPTRPVIPSNEEITDTRIRLSLDPNDILFHVDPNHWDLAPTIEDGPLLLFSFNPAVVTYSNNNQTLVFQGNVPFLNQGNEYFKVTFSDGSISYYTITGSNYNISSQTSEVTIYNNDYKDLSNAVAFYKISEGFADICTTYYNNTYGVGAGDDGYLHIFFTEGTTYLPTAGCGKPTFVNLINMYSGRPTSHAALFVHEVGHSLGLSHTFPSGQFTDLPTNDSGSDGWCNSTNLSNNIMGYNGCRNYLSPMQIAKMRYTLVQNNDNKLTNCTLNSSPIVVTSSNLWDETQFMSGDLIIDNNAILTVTCDLFMPQGSKIVVKPGSRLIVSGGTITNYCGLDWQGIEVQGNSYARQIFLNQGAVILNNDATIEYALNGIRTIGTDNYGNMNWSQTGGIIQIDGAKFLNCRRGIEFLTYQNIVTGGEIDNISIISNAQFIWSENTNNGALNPYAGITMYNVKGITISSCTFDNQISQGGGLVQMKEESEFVHWMLHLH